MWQPVKSGRHAKRFGDVKGWEKINGTGMPHLSNTKKKKRKLGPDGKETGS